jgi:hypothetical protein
LESMRRRERETDACLGQILVKSCCSPSHSFAARATEPLPPLDIAEAFPANPRRPSPSLAHSGHQKEAAKEMTTPAP